MKNLFNRSILCAAVVAMCVACNINNPEHSSNLEGVWYEKSDIYTQSLVFDKEGVLQYRIEPDITAFDIPEGGHVMYFKYILSSNSKLRIENPSDRKEYVTPYNIQEDVLTIDSFITDNPLYHFQLHRGEKIEKYSLPNETRVELDKIFNLSNSRLSDYSYGNVYVIGSDANLQAICPEGVTIPNIDFEKQSIVFTVLMLPSINDKIEESSLWRNPENNLFEYLVAIRKCKECYDAIDYRCSYSVYQIPSSEIRIKPIVQLIDR